jgi:hypothetical protein
MARGRIIGTGEPENNAGDDANGHGGDGNGNLVIIDASAVERASGDGNDSGTGRDNNDSGGTRRRGRPRGSGGTATKTAKALDLSSLTGLLLGFHAIAAIKVPEMAMTEPEALQLKNAMENVSRHYPIRTTQKAIDIAALVGVVGWVYGTRLVAIGKRRENEKKAKAAPPTDPSQPAWPDSVTPFRQ